MHIYIYIVFKCEYSKEEGILLLQTWSRSQSLMIFWFTLIFITPPCNSYEFLPGIFTPELFLSIATLLIMDVLWKTHRPG